MTQASRLAFFELSPTCLQAMVNLSATVKKSALGPRLIELVLLRVSQINGCGVCVDMHWRDLMRQEAEPRHVNAVAAWREAPFFTARERAALRWAEAVAGIPLRTPDDADFAELQQHFSDNEIAELGYAIAVITGWNLLNVSFRNQIPLNPPPGF
ncbi:carboxymuconolactone decarboxylase family protein [Duganella sp. LX20W]|uniref:Carboxymuconolactone decarboxylase family protein n=1 Tax=Rugamonas brunnea TaxID=2758569 RepID=A0A7W2EQ42_9BURK|nr:carboxymuconolactone decarboxylase family protein [Rugamonas brunnea]MBA5636595.1 carboxymuconolactone decarboxylase family protein [Rugamonas brunnea]